MCLIVFSVGCHPQFPLVVTANRDEFHQRPTAPMHWWGEPAVLAGRDLASGGTWLAVSKTGQISAVTNVREGGAAPKSVSRGALPLMALTESSSHVEQYLQRSGQDYAGFNLIHVTAAGGDYYSNRDTSIRRNLHRGLYGLSNHLLQSPWPKLLKLRDSIGQTLAQSDCHHTRQLHDVLIEQMQDTQPAPDHCLPDTGVGLELERMLSSPFIIGREYGTRATTVATVDVAGTVMVTEQSWGPEGRDDGQLQFSWAAGCGAGEECGTGH
ncbi:NRDE family protein [Marinobacter changyiensis]|uniref:NRDE family protein n=1 Tax=Marinobacter changyiensis TaxID=2604091 RepID=UPI0012649403|nr:NRDE family protein [Marinobacter changyiensis]